MEAINIQPTDETPGITLDKTSQQLRMWGNSLPEDVTVFFEPVLQWLEHYKSAPNQATVFDFNMTYFNTASSKIILDILTELEDLSMSGQEVLVKWSFREDDEEMEEAGEEYSEIVEVPFKLIAT